MLPTLDNFVSFGTEVFKARADYRQMFLDIYTSSVTNEHLGEHDAVNGSKLAEAMLLNLRGHADEVSQYVLTLYAVLINVCHVTGFAADNQYCVGHSGNCPELGSAARESRGTRQRRTIQSCCCLAHHGGYQPRNCSRVL